MYKNNSYNYREELNQCNRLNRDNTNCRQYCFGLLGLISAVLMSGMFVSLQSHLECPTHVVTSQS